MELSLDLVKVGMVALSSLAGTGVALFFHGMNTEKRFGDQKAAVDDKVSKAKESLQADVDALKQRITRIEARQETLPDHEDFAVLRMEIAKVAHALAELHSVPRRLERIEEHLLDSNK